MINSKSKSEITFRISDAVYTHTALFIDLENCSLVVHRFVESDSNTGHFEIFDLRENPELTEVYDSARAAWDLEAIHCLLYQPPAIAAAAD